VVVLILAAAATFFFVDPLGMFSGGDEQTAQMQSDEATAARAKRERLNKKKEQTTPKISKTGEKTTGIGGATEHP